MLIPEKTITAPVRSVAASAPGRRGAGVVHSLQALVVVAYAFTYGIPLLSFLTGCLATFVIIHLTHSGRLWLALASAVCAAGLGMLFSSPGLSPGARVVFLTWALAPPLVYGVTWRLTRSAGHAALALFIGVSVFVIWLFALGGEAVYLTLDIQESWLRQSAPSAYQWLSGWFETLRRLYPAFLGLTIATPAFTSWVIVVTLWEPETRRSFVDWRLGRPVLLAAALAVVGRFATQLAGSTLLTQIGDNLLFVLIVAFAITGLFALEYFFRHIGLHPGIKAPIYVVLMVTLHIGGLALALVGMLDTLINVRQKLGVPVVR
ncbi:MAG: DUF2232 domain-containing protein [Candidatus Zixiibacteriota bacterium]